MSKRINKKPVLIYNSISDQQKTNANSLDITEWNNIINVLKTQANANTKHIETLHRFLIDNYDANTFGDLVLNVDESLIPHLMNKSFAGYVGIIVSSTPPENQQIGALWCDTSNSIDE